MTQPSSEAAGRAHRASILLVDDHPANLLALEGVLEPLDQTLVRAMSGEEALKCVAEQEFAVILMDVRMPGLDGFETASRIRQRKQSRHTPIIFITADGEYRDHAFRGYSHGAVDFLIKPLDPAALVSKVKVFVDLYVRGETIRAQGAALREAERDALERQSETRLQTIIDLMPLCVLALHADGKPYFGNRAWREYTGVELDRASVGALLEAVHPEDRARAQRASSEAVATGKGSELECRLRSAHDGSFRWYVARGLPELGADGNVVGWIVTATDVERQKQAERHANAANRMKDEFLAVVSHELRTPLTAILGWAGILQTGTPEATKLQRGLDTIQRSARTQARLIEDILDVARIISGKMRLEPRVLDVTAVVRSAIDAGRPAAEAKGVALVAKLEPVPPTLADSERLQQVVGNLLTNGIKFTPKEGTVEVSVRSVGPTIEMAVRDTGRGIDPDFLPHVFDRFRQADSTTSRAQTGLGLGLAIVHHIVQLHNGRITANSAGLGQGSTFSVTLPVREMPAPQIQTRRETPLPGRSERTVGTGTLHGVKILLVDDEADSRDFLTQVLGSAGGEVISAASCREAIDIFARSPTDVLLSDIGLPGEDGYSLIHAIRALPHDKGGSVPAAALTAYTRPEDATRALEAGFDLHVPKPIEPFEVIGVVADLAQLQR